MKTLLASVALLALLGFVVQCGDATSTGISQDGEVLAGDDRTLPSGDDHGVTGTDGGDTARHDGGDVHTDSGAQGDTESVSDGGAVTDGAVSDDVPVGDDVQIIDAGGDQEEDGGPIPDAGEDTGTQYDSGGESPDDAGFQPDAGGDAGEDGGTPDAGPEPCVIENENCTLLPCCAGVSCNASDVCAVDGTCKGAYESCNMDGDCCRPGGLHGSWCNESGRCSSCAEKDGHCASDYDCCPSTAPLICTSKKTCQPICNSNADCTGGAICVPGGECVGPLCSSDAACNGQRCCGGECRGDCGYGAPASCIITTPGGVIANGRKTRLHAVAYIGDPKQGAQIVPWTVFQWSSSSPAIAMVDSSTGEVTGGSASGRAEISAAAGSLNCGKVIFDNYLSVTPGNVRVLVVDERTGIPVTGADVIVGSGAAVKTDASGRAQVASAPADVHVFHKDRSWVSVVGLAKSEYIIHMPPNRAGPTMGGFKGGFDPSTFGSGMAKIGRACTSYRTDQLDWGILLYYGFVTFELGLNAGCDEPILTHHKMETSKGGPTDYDGWGKVPGGEYLSATSYGITQPPAVYRVLGEPGYRTAWGIGGTIPSKYMARYVKITGQINQNGKFPMGLFMSSLFPLIEGFSHAVKSLFEVTPIPKIPTPKSSDGTPLVDTSTMADYDNFPDVTLPLTARMYLSTVVTLPDLPRLQGRCIRGVYAEGETYIPGMGAITLGKTAGLDNPDNTDIEGDCRVNKPQYNPASLVDGQVRVLMAPGHHGLENNPYRVVAMAAELGAPSTVISDIYQYIPQGGALNPVSARILWADDLASAYDFSAKPFLSFPEKATYTSILRKITGSVVAVSGSAFYRYRVGNANGDWFVYTTDNTRTITLPSVPAGLSDRASGAGMSAHAVSLAGTTLDSLVTTAGDAHLDTLFEVTDAYSRLTCLRKLGIFDPDYSRKCNPPDPNTKDPACNPACELK